MSSAARTVKIANKGTEGTLNMGGKVETRCPSSRLGVAYTHVVTAKANSPAAHSQPSRKQGQSDIPIEPKMKSVTEPGNL